MPDPSSESLRDRMYEQAERETDMYSAIARVPSPAAEREDTLFVISILAFGVLTLLLTFVWALMQHNNFACLSLTLACASAYGAQTAFRHRFNPAGRVLWGLCVWCVIVAVILLVLT